MLNFPDTPVINDTFTAASDTWRWDGVKWLLLSGGPFLSLSGGTMTGPLVLSGDPVPTAPLMPVTLQYFNTHASPAGVVSFNTRVGMVTLNNADVVAVLPSSAALPLMDGTAAAGSLTTWSRGDHQHPADTSRVAKAGDTMSGGLHFGSSVASGVTDLSRHIDLYGGTYGFSITSSEFNYVSSGTTNAHAFWSGSTWIGTLSTSGFNTPGSITASSTIISLNGHVVARAATGQLAAVNTSSNTGVTLMSWNDGNQYIGRTDVNGTYNGTVLMTFDASNNVNIGGQTFTAGYMHSTGSAQIDNALGVTNMATAGSIMSNSGVFYIGGNTNYYLARNSSDGYWRFVENGTVNLTIETGGNIRARMDIQALGGWIYSAGMVYAGYASFNDMYFGPGASGRTFNWASQCYLDFDPSAQLSYVRFGSWIMSCRNDAILGDNTSYVAGNGAYSNWSDIRIKKDIEDAPYGLAHILRIRPRRFMRKPHPQEHRINRTLRPEIGFVAQEVADIIPEAVTELAVHPSQFAHGEDTAFALQSEMLLAAAINAIKELSAEVEQLKRRMP